MSKTVTLKGFVYESDYGLGDDKKGYSFYSSDTFADQWNTLVGPAEFRFTIPESYDPTAHKIAALERERDQVRADFTKKLSEINERLSKLQALTYEAPEVVS